ncbi:MAG: hypothetical protein GX604_02275 [Actinobacteria bacterium]|nr:hypothetical protein [Actinomycetota bacterium]
MKLLDLGRVGGVLVMAATAAMLDADDLSPALRAKAGEYQTAVAKLDREIVAAQGRLVFHVHGLEESLRAPPRPGYRRHPFPSRPSG